MENTALSEKYISLLDDFAREFRAILGAYFDGTTGYPKVAEEMARLQTLSNAKLEKKASMQELDSRKLILSEDKPWKQKWFYAATMGDIKKRNAAEGENVQSVGCMTIVYLYHLWDESYREAFAALFGIVDKKLIKVDAFGDLRNLRNAIIHNKRIATKEVEANKVFSWFKRGEAIKPTMKHFQQLSYYLNNDFIREIQKSLAQANPTVRFVSKETKAPIR